MNNNKREFDGFFLFKEDGPYGDVMVITGPWRKEFEEFMRKEKIQWLRLSDGWTDDNIEFVTSLNNLKVLQVYKWRINDLTPMENLTDLEQISFGCSLKKSIDLSSFPRLRKCSLDWSKKVESILECKNLNHLSISKYPFENLNAISHMKSLTNLQLSSHKLKSLDGIQDLENLKVLDLYMCVKLEDLTRIGELPNIKKVEMTSCKKIHDISALGLLSSVERVRLANCGKIMSLKPLKNCKILNDLCFYEDTFVEDGDMGVLLEMPQLKRALYAERRHYSPKKEEVQEALKKRTE